MGSLRDEMKKEYAGMSTSNLKGVISQGQKALEDWVRSLAPEGHPEQLIKESAQDVMNDISEELKRRGT